MRPTFGILLISVCFLSCHPQSTMTPDKPHSTSPDTKPTTTKSNPSSTTTPKANPNSSNTITTKINSPIQPLPAAVFGGIGGPPDVPTVDDTQEPYKSGKIKESSAPNLIKSLGGDASLTTIIHLLRWADTAHSKLMFDAWYVFDPKKPRTAFYLPPSAEFTGTSIPGRTNFQFIYIHLNYNLTNGTSEWMTPAPPGGGSITYLHPVTYTIAVTKAQTQFIQDL